MKVLRTLALALVALVAPWVVVAGAALFVLSRHLLLARVYPDYFHARHLRAWPVVLGFDLVAALSDDAVERQYRDAVASRACQLFTPGRTRRLVSGDAFHRFSRRRFLRKTPRPRARIHHVDTTRFRARILV